MAKHNDLGKAGENAAVAYLEQKGYLIRNRNWRKGHFELDIVAAKDNELIVIEVKTRSNTLFAEPEDAVDLPKIRRTYAQRIPISDCFRLTLLYALISLR